MIVNRVWQWHFGQGIVRTPSDFGMRSDPPSHPELLDWLALRFVEDPSASGPGMGCGWSLKRLHKLILTSAAYQQSSDDNPEARKSDPENLLLWRFNRQRLDWEETRDALVFVGGGMDEKVGGRPVDITDPKLRPADDLRLHRPPEPSRPLPRVRHGQPRHDQPAAV